jgi:hypothetical protein
MKMKAAIVLCALVLVLSGFGCGQEPASQATYPSQPEVPEPKLVPYANIPYPRPNTLYRIAGANLTTGPTDVLERVLEAGFDLRRAWHPQVALCMVFFLDELIIELGEPDDAIYGFGFSSDFTGTSGPCTSHWNEYDFVQ